MKIILVLFLFAIADGQYEEGDSCNKNGISGVCTFLRECPSAIEDRKNRRPVQNCGFGGMDPIVCCVSQAPVATTMPRKNTNTKLKNRFTQCPKTYDHRVHPPEYTYVDVDDKVAGPQPVKEGQCEPIPPSLTAARTGQKSWDKCLEYQDKLVFPCGRSQALGGGMSRSNRCHHNADELIIGGQAADPNEFPHMALLGYGDDPANLQWLCGGSLISEKFILTAGHCIASRDGGEVSHVQLNTLLRSSMPARDRYRVARIHRHPQYKPPHKYHDIALLELERAVTMSDTVVPACLHNGFPVNDSRASVTGWGLTSYNGKTSNNLQKVILTKFDAFECAGTYPPNRLMKQGLDDSSQICFGDRTMSKDTCQGDSGGPLQLKHKKIACMYTLLGITSFGAACGFVGVPGIYTRVANYIGWIEPIVWP